MRNNSKDNSACERTVIIIDHGLSAVLSLDMRLYLVIEWSWWKVVTKI